MAAEMGMGVIPWSPLGSGVLTGKYSRADLGQAREGSAAEGTRRDVALGNGSLTERSLDIADIVREIADETGHSSAQIALAWTLLNPAVTAPIIGARTLAQLDDNLGALDVVLDDRQRSRLDGASAIELGFPHSFLARPMTRAIMEGGVSVRRSP
jgi:aryl-alcohol dehydrogenase-like predicted oxidoreductase